MDKYSVIKLFLDTLNPAQKELLITLLNRNRMGQALDIVCDIQHILIDREGYEPLIYDSDIVVNTHFLSK